MVTRTRLHLKNFSLRRRPSAVLIAVIFAGTLVLLGLGTDKNCASARVQKVTGVTGTDDGPYCGGGGGSSGGGGGPPPPTYYTLSVSRIGNGLVTSNPGGISCSPTCNASYLAGTSIALTATPDPGWGLSAWGGSCSGNGGCFVFMNTNRSVSATFVRLRTLSLTIEGSGSVTFSPGGGICSGGTCTFIFLDNTAVTVTPSAGTSYAFGRWSGDCSGSSSCNITMSQDRAVTATFDPATVVTRTGPGTITSVPLGISCGLACTTYFPLGSSYTLTATPDSGYIFQGWSGDCTGTGTCTLTASAPHAVAARFGPWLTVTTVGGGGAVSAPAGISCGANAACTYPFTSGSAVMVTATPDAGYVFGGWSGDCIGTGSCEVTMGADRAVTASFRPVLTISTIGSGIVTSTPSGIDCGTTCSMSVPYQSSVTLTSTPSADFVFGGWSGACSGTGPCTVTMDQPRAAGAIFLELFTLTVQRTAGGSVTSAPSGITCGATCIADFPDGTSIALTATPDPGFIFAGWGGACIGTGACGFPLTGDTTVTATFQPVLTVAVAIGSGNVTSAPAGIVCSSGTCTAPFPLNTVVTLTPTPSAGWAFRRWAGDCTGSGACSVTMSQPHAIGAEFGPILTVIRNGSGTITSFPTGIDCGTTCSAPFDVGTTIALTPSLAFRWVFDSWGGACVGVAGCGFVLNAPASVTATFLPLRTVSMTVGTGGRVVSLPAGVDCGSQCSMDVVDGMEVALVAQPDAGHRLSAWSGATCADPDICPLTVVADVTVAATFELLPTHALSVSVANPVGGSVIADIGGIDCGIACSAAIPEGTTVEFAPRAAEGYIFGGWTGNCTGTEDCTVVVDAAKLVTALFTPVHDLAVASGGMGGGTVTDTSGAVNCEGCSATFTEGAPVTLHAAPRLDSTFTGGSGDCSGTVDCNINLTGDRTVTANYTKNKRHIRVSSQTGVQVTSSPAGLSCPPSCDGLFDPSTTVTLSGSGVNTSYIFKSWSGACAFARTVDRCTVITDRDLDVTATGELTFGGGTYPLTVVVPTGATIRIDVPMQQSDNCTGPGSCTFNYTKGKELYLWTLNAPLQYGMFNGECRFTGTLNACELLLNGPRTVSLNTGAVERLDVTPSPNGTILAEDPWILCGTYCSMNYVHGAVRTLTAWAQPGYFFDGWTGACSGIEPCTVTMDGYRTLGATFRPVEVKLTVRAGAGGTVVSDPAGIICGATCEAIFPTDTSVNLTATPLAGVKFGGWGGACTGTNTSCTVLMSEAKNVTATFTVNASVSIVGGGGSLTVYVDPGGVSTCTGRGCTKTVNYNGTLTFVANAPAGYVFAGWSGACASAGSNSNCALSMTTPASVTATFRNALTVLKAGSGTGVVTSNPTGINCGTTCSMNFKQGVTVVLFETPNPGMLANSWVGCTMNYGSTCKVRIDGTSKTVTALFGRRF